MASGRACDTMAAGIFVSPRPDLAFKTLNFLNPLPVVVPVP